MAVYYVRKTGSDGAAGTSPAAAWLTVQRSMNSGAVVNGDQVWIGAGVYRETLLPAMTVPTSAIIYTGDVDGAQTGDAGEVIITAYTTNDTTAPSATNLLALNGKNFLAFEKITFIGGNSAISNSASPSRNNRFSDCTIIDAKTGSSPATINIACTAANVALAWVIERCRIIAGNVGGASVIALDLTRPATADFNYNVQITDCFCLAISGAFVAVNASGANTFNGGGVAVNGCTFIGDSAILRTNSVNLSTSIPCTLKNSLHWGGSAAPVNATTSGQITEDHNHFFTGTARTNVTAGTGSILGNATAPLLSIGQEAAIGKIIRPFFTPLAGAPQLGFGTATGASATDLIGRPRPAGGPLTPAAGALERHDTAAVGATLGADSGGYTEITGPGDQDYKLWVGASATTVSVKVKWDATYANTNKPQMLIIANARIGVTLQTITATGTAGSAYETLTANFTPTAAGLVTIRLVSRSAAAAGIVAFDTFTVT